MSVKLILTYVVGLSMLGGLIGLGIGSLVGVFMPDFIFVLVHAPVDPVQLGAFLGLMNGLLFGFITSLLVVLVQAFGKRKE